jgi:hypothetical protein
VPGDYGGHGDEEREREGWLVDGLPERRLVRRLRDSRGDRHQTAYGLLMSPRRYWLDDRAAELMDELDQLGLILSRDQARRLVKERVQAVANGMRITEQSARRYVDGESVRDLARLLAMEFAEEQPGVDVLAAPRIIPMPPQMLGQVVAALAEAGQLRLAGNDADGASGLLQVISMLGQVLNDWDSSGRSMLLPQAALTRGARLLRNMSDLLREQPELAFELPDDDVERLADAMARDAATLRDLVATYGGASGPTPDS